MENRLEKCFHLFIYVFISLTRRILNTIFMALTEHFDNLKNENLMLFSSLFWKIKYEDKRFLEDAMEAKFYQLIKDSAKILAIKIQQFSIAAPNCHRNHMFYPHCIIRTQSSQQIYSIHFQIQFLCREKSFPEKHTEEKETRNGS